jgi:hypothetical protein
LNFAITTKILRVFSDDGWDPTKRADAEGTPDRRFRGAPNTGLRSRATAPDSAGICNGTND